MKRLADENLDLSVVARLRQAGHQVLAVAEMAPGIPDGVVLDRVLGGLCQAADHIKGSCLATFPTGFCPSSDPNR